MQHVESEAGIRQFVNDPNKNKAGLAKVIVEAAKAWTASYPDITFPSVAVPVEKQTVSLIEIKPIPQEFRSFTDQEKEALVKDGAFILDLTTGNTIEDQERAGRLFRHIVDGGDRLLKLPSIKTRVAIYPDPKRFFIPKSGNKDLATQEELAKRDGQELRQRLGLKDDSLDVIIPDQASTLTELTFKYLDETTQKGKGVWLFGPDYAAALGLSSVYGRTKNPVNESGSPVADVGDACPALGVDVDCWNRDDGDDSLHVVRLVVAKKK